MAGRRPILAYVLVALCAVGVVACARGKAGGTLPGGGGGTIIPPPRAVRPPFTPALLSAAAGSGQVRVDFGLPGDGYEAALFVSADRGVLFEGEPARAPLSGDPVVLDNLSDGVELFLGLAVRGGASGPYVPSGAVLRATPGAPLYVDAAADPAVADGLSPATAFADLGSAFLAAVFQGGGNLWVKGGSYEAGGTLAFPGTHVFGGFGPEFDLATREPAAGRTVIRGVAGQQVLAVAGGAPAVVLDGLRLDGEGRFPIGIDVDNSPLELRQTQVRGFTGRGLRLRNSSGSEVIGASIVGCEFAENGGDGVSGAGAFDVHVDASTFDANVQEGLDFDDLVAPDGETSRIVVTGCRFFGNGAEGMDLDLAAPATPGPTPGRFRVTVRGCRFELNGLAGLLVDGDYETALGWTAEIAVRECLARGNGGAGFAIDADAPAATVLHRVLATANRGDGVLVTSESDPGLVVVAASVAGANGGAGFRAALGSKPFAASHCIASGNRGGGFVSDLVESTATSCVAHLQLEPWRAVRRSGCVDVVDPDLPAFRWAPRAFAEILARNGLALVLSAGLDAELGDPVEVGDDGVLRSIQAIDGTTVTIDTEPDAFFVPGPIAAFDAGGQHVVEDYRLETGSVIAGRGLSAPGMGPVDAGVFGAPATGEAGFADTIPTGLFRLDGSTPAVTVGLSPSEPLELRFSGAVDPASLAGTPIRVVTEGGVELVVTPTVTGSTVQVPPPSGSWGAQSLLVEVHRSLADVDGHPLATPLTLSIPLR